jgi:hypothetical protein
VIGAAISALALPFLLLARRQHAAADYSGPAVVAQTDEPA